MRTILLYGDLGKRFGREHRFAVRSASEAIHALCVNFPEFKSLMRSVHKFGVGFKVFVGTSSLKKEADALLPSSDDDTIRIAPAVFGSGGWTKVLVGAVLVVGGLAVNAIFALPTGGGSTLVGNAMISVGVGLILNGTFELLSGPPKLPANSGQGEDVNGQSYIFTGPENVTRQGSSVPIGYGRMMVGSTVISAGIEDQDQ